jgi:hypothetical protein
LQSTSVPEYQGHTLCRNKISLNHAAFSKVSRNFKKVEGNEGRKKTEENTPILFCDSSNAAGLPNVGRTKIQNSSVNRSCVAALGERLKRPRKAVLRRRGIWGRVFRARPRAVVSIVIRNSIYVNLREILREEERLRGLDRGSAWTVCAGRPIAAASRAC